MEISPVAANGDGVAGWGGIELADLPFRIFAALFVALLAVACVPLVLTPLPALVDYPNHLARMHVIANLSRSPLLRQYYAVVWRPVPDLAMDILIPPLLRVVSLETAGKLFLAVTYFLLTGGAAVLHRVLYRRWSAWSLVAFLLVYNRLLLWGLVNFLFGLGLAFWAFAGWIAWCERRTVLRLAVGAVAALAIYFSHLMAFGIYGAMVLGYETGRLWRRRAAPDEVASALFVALLPLLPALASFAAVFVPLHAAPFASGVHFARPARKVDLLFSVFDLYNRPFDVACFALALIATAAAYWRRWLRLAPEIVAPLILLALLYVLVPDTLFGATGADRRLPLAMALLLIGGSAWQAPVAPHGRVFLAAALVMFAVRLGIVAASWQASGRVYAELLAGLDALPRGARVAVAFSAAEVNVEAAPLLHFPVLAVARRDAFVPTLFAYATQQPITFNGEYGALAGRLSADALWRFYIAGDTPMEPALAHALARCGYITFAGRQPFVPRTGTGLIPVFVSPRFQIYRLPGTPL
ncbi:MAG: hypothetical protein KGL11_07560 [Alphaproteobacteria bacterium]|nr:hypothetical protein [Alphaproteobacteria bacterium]